MEIYGGVLVYFVICIHIHNDFPSIVTAILMALFAYVQYAQSTSNLQLHLHTEEERRSDIS